MIFPRSLTKGDKIAIVSPSGRLQENSLDAAIKILTSWGLQVVLGKHVYDTNNYFAGQDSHRIADLQEAFDEPSIAAVLCARGGYGVTRIMEKIELNSIKKTPKWVIGYSDITALHLRLENQGIAGIHGPMGTSFSDGKAHSAIESLRDLLFNKTSKISAMEPGVTPGLITAPITGGNLSLIVDSLGTPDEIDTQNKILFIEEIAEKTYKIDRMFQQLLRAGKLDKLAGLIIGHFSEIDEGSTPFGESWKEVITNIAQNYSYPLSFGFNIGHEPANYPVVIGGQYQLNVGPDMSTLEWIAPV
ncbi:MAG: LD-carboxypeptidase [Bacteroidetes bacterium]|nr:MAG: LD-carboxypeptidase [Bacteroidota bacterium]